MSWTEDTIFKRSDAGDKEIRDRVLQLSKMEQLVLVSVDGASTVDQMVQPFDELARTQFRDALDSLLSKSLVEPLARLDLGVGVDVGEDFFSSSMGGMVTGSGLVVDTKNNSMRSVRQRSKADEVDLFIPLDNEELHAKSKRVKKLVEVYPAPRREKKRRKKVQPPPTNKWLIRACFALIVLGLVIVLLALLRG